METLKQAIITDTAEDIINTFNLDMDIYDICEIINIHMGWCIEAIDEAFESGLIESKNGIKHVRKNKQRSD